MLPELEKMLRYEHKPVLMRYAGEYPNARLSAEDAFEELKKYMWLCLKLRAERLAFPKDKQLMFICSMHEEMVDIDHMWHTFLLFTKDYQLFCDEYLGEFFHHEPRHDDSQISDDDYAEELKSYLEYIYINLGEDTVGKWFCPDSPHPGPLPQPLV